MWAIIHKWGGDFLRILFFFVERFSSIVLKHRESTSKSYLPVGLQRNVCTPKLVHTKTAYIGLLSLKQYINMLVLYQEKVHGR